MIITEGGEMMKRITVGILAHVDSGKTTLSEAMMYLSGNIGKLGRVDHRDSFLDTYALERDRGITIFSKQALIDQLKSENGEKFTEEQAAQAVEYLETNSMVDWNEQAVKAAKQYMEISSFSKDGLIEQLTSEYGGRFTAEQAEYAVSQLGLE